MNNIVDIVKIVISGILSLVIVATVYTILFLIKYLPLGMFIVGMYLILRYFGAF